MRRPEDKRKCHSKPLRLFVRYISEEDKDKFYAAIDRIRQARVPKKRAITWLEPSPAEVMEEFA